MSRKIVSLGTIRSPEVAPAAGYWESLSFLDEYGYLMNSSYMHAMASTGLRCINPRAKDDPIYSVTNDMDGLFAEGVSPLGHALLQILANEGFEGEVRDLGQEEGRVWFLSAGSLRCGYDSFADDDGYEMPIMRVA